MWIHFVLKCHLQISPLLPVDLDYYKSRRARWHMETPLNSRKKQRQNRLSCFYYTSYQCLFSPLKSSWHSHLSLERMRLDFTIETNSLNFLPKALSVGRHGAEESVGPPGVLWPVCQGLTRLDCHSSCITLSEGRAAWTNPWKAYIPESMNWKAKWELLFSLKKNLSLCSPVIEQTANLSKFSPPQQGKDKGDGLH